MGVIFNILMTLNEHKVTIGQSWAFFSFIFLFYLSSLIFLKATCLSVSLFSQLKDYTSYRKTAQATGLPVFFKVSFFWFVCLLVCFYFCFPALGLLMWPEGGCSTWRAPTGTGPGSELQPVERSPHRKYNIVIQYKQTCT